MRCARSWRRSWRARWCRSTARMRRSGSVGSVSVARVARVDDSHALVTVAAAATGGTRYLTVPVARDARGGLVVSDLPSLAAPPARASVPVRSLESVPAGERGAIEDVVSRFMADYLAGDAGALSLLHAVGRADRRARPGARARRRRLAGAGWRRRRAARVRCWRRSGPRTRRASTYGLRYRLRLVREDRWLVAAVNTTKKAG